MNLIKYQAPSGAVALTGFMVFLPFNFNYKTFFPEKQRYQMPPKKKALPLKEKAKKVKASNVENVAEESGVV